LIVNRERERRKFRAEDGEGNKAQSVLQSSIGFFLPENALGLNTLASCP
jgi:hypothetical protein